MYQTEVNKLFAIKDGLEVCGDPSIDRVIELPEYMRKKSLWVRFWNWLFAKNFWA